MVTNLQNNARRLIKLIILMIFAGLCVFPAFAQEEVEGDAAGEWTLENSPYNIIGDITVPEDQELVIEAGVAVNFNGTHRFIVEGTLTAIGDAENNILFTSEAEDADDWGQGLEFVEGSASELEFVVIENQHKPDIDEDNPSRGGGLKYEGGGHELTHSTVRNCRASFGGGLYLYNAVCEIEDVDFISNSARLSGGAISAGAGLHLTGCFFTGNRLLDEDSWCQVVYFSQQERSEETIEFTHCRLEENGQNNDERVVMFIGMINCEYDISFCEIINNNGQGIFFNNPGMGGVTLDHFTVVGNAGIGMGGDGWNIGMTNSILFDNGEWDAYQWGVFINPPVLVNCFAGRVGGLVDEEDPVEGANPLFFDAEGLIDNEADLRLRAASPCIGAGIDGVDLGANPFDAEEIELEIELVDRWNGISFSVVPEELNLRRIFTDAVENENLSIIKDMWGDFYAPEFDFCSIDRWNYSEGYYLRTVDQDVLTVEGIRVPVDEPIDLLAGWNIIACYLREEMISNAAFGGLEGIILVKNIRGQFWIPFHMVDFWVQPNDAIWVKVEEDVRFAYPLIEDDNRAMAAGGESFWSGWDALANRFGLQPTGASMNILVENGAIRPDDYIIAKNNQGIVRGAGLCSSGLGCVILYGSGEFDLKGFREGEPVELYLCRDGVEARLNYEPKPIHYEKNGFLRIDAAPAVESAVPKQFTISDIYPNPFNQSATVKFGLAESANVTLAIYDLNGKLQKSLVSGKYNAGFHSVAFNASGLTSGVYFLKLNTGLASDLRKIVLIR